MRTGSFAFEAPICVAELSAAAIWWTSDCWPSACTPSPTHPHGGKNGAACVPICVTAARLDALALDETSFSCLRAPSFPALPIRIGPAELPDELPHPHFDLPGSWNAADAASAHCQIDECCPSACTPLPPCTWLPTW
jgi:hypothetical protein